MPDETILCLFDTIPTSYHAVVCADVKEGDSVAIWGLGSVGLLCSKWSKVAGVRRVIAIDTVPKRLKMAKDKGCDVIDSSQTKDVVAATYETEPESVDCCIDATAFRHTKSLTQSAERALGMDTDSSEQVDEMLRAVRKFGTICLICDHAAFMDHFLIGALMEKGITPRGGGQVPVQKYWKEPLKKIESGEFDSTIILSHRFDISEFSELYDHFDKKYGVAKTFVQPRFSKPPALGTPQLSSLKKGDIKPSNVLS